MRSEVNRIAIATGLGLVILGIAGCGDEPVGPNQDRQYIAVATGGDHSCAVDQAGAAYCWGRNSDGELGNGTLDDASVPTRVMGDHVFKSITAGDAHTCALADDGIVWCWGWNAYYQLGITKSVNQRIPQQLETTARFSAISAGAHHTCGITLANDVMCWGYNRYGQNGNGITQTTVPAEQVAGSLKATRISTGRFHTCAIATGGVAQCWGRNDFGQLGIGTDAVFFATPINVRTQLRFTQIDAGATHTCGVAAGVGYCWGSNEHGEIGDGAPFKPGLPGPTTPTPIGLLQAVRVISAGFGKTCAAETSNASLCWGWNTYGQLGIGSTADKSFPHEVFLSPNRNLTFSALATDGATHACGIADGVVYCWGDGPSGQLGGGTHTFSVLPQRVS